MVKKVELIDVKYVDNLLKARTRDITRVHLRNLYVCKFLDENWLFATNGRVMAGVPVHNIHEMQTGEEYTLADKEPTFDLDDETIVELKLKRAKPTGVHKNIQRIVDDAQCVWSKYKYDYTCRRLGFEYLLRTLNGSRHERQIRGTDVYIDLPIVNPLELWFAPDIEFKVYDNLLPDYYTFFNNNDFILIAAGCINSREDLLKILKRKARK